MYVLVYITIPSSFLILWEFFFATSEICENIKGYMET